jgi:DNA-binding transcriptional ArsR family regulator
MRRRPNALVPLEEAICANAAALRAAGVEEFYGYELAKQLAHHADQRLLTAYGTLYRALGRLESMGLLTSRREDPEIAARYAAIVATGRSDYPNQINNVLAFPGIFRGALDAGAKRITEEMKLAAATAIAEIVAGDLRPDAIVPSPLDPRVAPAVAAAVADTARREGVCR